MKRFSGLVEDSPFDLRTTDDKRRYQLLEHLSVLAQYVANDERPSVYDRFTMLRAITDPRNWTAPRAAVERLDALLAKHRSNSAFRDYIGKAASVVQLYAKGRPVLTDEQLDELAAAALAELDQEADFDELFAQSSPYIPPSNA